MVFRIRHLAFLLTPPVFTAALLAGMVAQQQTYIKPADVEPYHARARAAIEAVPYVIGYWTGKDDDVPPAAQKLLRPNAILSRTYTDNQPSARGRRQASLLIVQCRDSRDMLGHFPPICYRAQGRTPEGFAGCMKDPAKGLDRDWHVGNTTIPGVEYRFLNRRQGRLWRTTVYNFFIVPGKGFVRDMQGVADAAEDYQQRYYGAAQFQLVFTAPTSEDLSQGEHDEIFATLMAPNLSLIKRLSQLLMTPRRHDFRPATRKRVPRNDDESYLSIRRGVVAPRWGEKRVAFGGSEKARLLVGAGLRPAPTSASHPGLFRPIAGSLAIEIVSKTLTSGGLK